MVFELLIYICLVIGVFFNVLAAVGLLRFPDVYTRLHAGTKCTTFGSIFLCAAVVFYGLKIWYFEGLWSSSSVLIIHTIVALICILVTNPTSAHAIARAAHRGGVLPVRAVVDDLKEKNRKIRGKKK